MITITVDPDTKVPPNFLLEEHRFAREAVMHGREDMSNERAVEILRERWRAGLERRRARWDEERGEREALRDEEQQRGTDAGGGGGGGRSQTMGAESPRARSPRQESLNSEENDRPNLVAGKVIPEVIEYPPARFAIKKLKEREYIELSYFTPESRSDAAKSESVSSTDVFTLTQDDNILSLKPAVNFRSKTKVIQDEDLTWEQLSVASLNFLEHIVQEGWPDNMIDAMHTFSSV